VVYFLKVPVEMALVALIAVSGVAEAKKRIETGPGCWTIPQITAAKINEFSILLNVQSLRCRNVDTAILGQYDAFTRASGATMKSVSQTVQHHFKNNSSAYDRYAISLANKYGAGVAGQSCAMVATLIQTAINKADSIDGMSQAAESGDINPTLVGGACPLHYDAPFVATPKQVAHLKRKRK